MKRYATRYIPLLAGVLAVTTACEHKELCFDHDEHAPKSAVHIQAEYEQEWELMCEGGTDWENEWKEEFGMEYDELRPDVPGGLRIQLYHEDGINNMLNVAPEGEVVQMRPGNHSVLLYNNDTESIVFDDMDSYASAKATTRTRTRASYFGSPYTETVRKLYRELYGGAQTGDGRIARYHAPACVPLSGAIRVQTRAGIRGVGTRGAGRHGGSGVAEQRTNR